MFCCVCACAPVAEVVSPLLTHPRAGGTETEDARELFIIDLRSRPLPFTRDWVFPLARLGNIAGQPAAIAFVGSTLHGGGCV